LWGSIRGSVLKDFIGAKSAIVWMIDQLQYHDLVAARTTERITIEGFKEELNERFARKDPKAHWIGR